MLLRVSDCEEEFFLELGNLLLVLLFVLIRKVCIVIALVMLLLVTADIDTAFASRIATAGEPVQVPLHGYIGAGLAARPKEEATPLPHGRVSP